MRAAANETKCPDCGVLMQGYEPGEICTECYYIDDAATQILHHVDTMYPKMWNGVAKTARTSIRNVIKSQIRELLS